MYLNFNGLKRIGILFTILILTGCSNVIWHQTQVGLNCGPTTLANVLNHQHNTILTGTDIQNKVGIVYDWWNDSDMIVALNRLGVPYTVGYGKPPNGVNLIIKEYVLSPFPNHYVYVYDYDTKTGLYSISDSLMGTYKDKIDNYYGFWIKF